MTTDFFKWDKIYETGILRIDLQHKIIVNILNELYDIIIGDKQEEKLHDIIYELMQYYKYHFKEEEILFKKYNFPDEKEHRKEHIKFIEKINSITSQINTDKEMAAIKLMNFLKDWLTDHILETDQKYVKFFKENGYIK